MANRYHTDVHCGFTERGGPRHRRQPRRPRMGKNHRPIEHPKTRVVNGAPGHTEVVQKFERMRS